MGAVLLLSAGPAWAAAPASCSAAPAAYTGPDTTVAALVALQTDADANCQALSDRLDLVDADVSAAKSQAHGDAGSASTDAATVAAAVNAVHSVVNGWTASTPLQVALPSGGGGGPVTVTNWPTDQTVGLDSASTSQADGIGQSDHGDLWVLIGAVVGCFLFDVFLRKVWP